MRTVGCVRVLDGAAFQVHQKQNRNTRSRHSMIFKDSVRCEVDRTHHAIRCQPSTANEEKQYFPCRAFTDSERSEAFWDLFLCPESEDVF